MNVCEFSLGGRFSLSLQIVLWPQDKQMLLLCASCMYILFKNICVLLHFMNIPIEITIQIKAKNIYGINKGDKNITNFIPDCFLTRYFIHCN